MCQSSQSSKLLTLYFCITDMKMLKKNQLHQQLSLVYTKHLNSVGVVGSVCAWVRGWCESNFGLGDIVGMGSNILALVRKYTVGGVGEIGLWDFGVSQKKKKWRRWCGWRRFEVFCWKDVIKNFTNLQENTCAGDSF